MFEAINEKLQLPINQLRVVTLDQCIDENSEGTLEKYGIIDGTTIHIVQRVHDGSDPPKGKCLLSRAELPMADLIKMSCGHTFSPIALVDYLDNIQTYETKLMCPVPECKKNWKQSEISSSGLTEEKFQGILESFVTNLTFSRYNCQKCPQCETLTERINKDRLRTECLICSKTERYEFCWSCLKTWKNTNDYKVCGNENCDPSNTDLMRQLETCDVKDIHGIKNVPAMRACPKCGMGISHTGGCKHMTCKICKTEFCFACLSIRVNKSWPGSCGAWDTKCTVAPRQKNISETQDSESTCRAWDTKCTVAPRQNNISETQDSESICLIL